jgi:transcriptional regulator with XRE-family HTH domain
MTRQASHQPGHPVTSSRRNGGPPWRARPREWRPRGSARTRHPCPLPEPHYSQADASDPYVRVTPPGIIGGTVIHATRRSARLTQRALARSLAVTPATIRSWENGTIPLFALPYDQIKPLAAALSQQSTQTGLLTELIIASQCDLLITRMLNGTEDYAEPPPIDEDTPEGTIARDLLRWALAGAVPGHHEEHARRGPLIDHHDNLRLADLAQQLATGEHGHSLVSFGIALAEITRAE